MDTKSILSFIAGVAFAALFMVMTSIVIYEKTTREGEMIDACKYRGTPTLTKSSFTCEFKEGK